jgi:hypothetical protein
MSYVGKGCVALGGGLALLWAVGCASPNVYTRPSPAQISAAEDAVHAAKVRGADHNAQAAPFLASAERQLNAGKRSLNEGDDRNATWLLARAAADGQLSHAMTERARLEAEANTTERQLAETRGNSPPPPPPANTPVP